MNLINDKSPVLENRQNRITHHENVLLEQYGPLLQGNDLLKVAGYRSSEALRMAIRRNKVGFDVFILKGRRGRFAHVKDIAAWLVDVEDGIGRK